MLNILRKVLESLLAVLGIFIVLYILTSFVPGDPAQLMMGRYSNPDTYSVLSREMNVENSAATGVLEYLGDVVKGDLGRSWISHRPVGDIIAETLPVTIKLCVFALAFALIIGISLGAWSAYKENTITDRVIEAFSVAGFSLPHFWLALLLQIVFGLILKVLPVSGTGEGQFYFYILPGLSIGIPLGMIYTRLVRSVLADILDKPFILAAKGWGLPGHRIFLHHVAPNCIYLLFLQVATDAAFLLGGAVVAETIFALPGLGSTLVSAVTARDWPVAHGVVLITALIVCSLNLIVKLTGPFLDARLRKGISGGGADY